MSEFASPDTIGEVHLLDHGELQAGYYAAERGAPEPIASFFSRSFWFGWRLGRCDASDELLDAPDVACHYVYGQLATVLARLH